MNLDFLHRENAIIVRLPDGKANLTREGRKHPLWTFDEDWTDDQILDALDFANVLYDRGHWNGQKHKARQICAALGAVPADPDAG